MAHDWLRHLQSRVGGSEKRWRVMVEKGLKARVSERAWRGKGRRGRGRGNVLVFR